MSIRLAGKALSTVAAVLLAIVASSTYVQAQMVPVALIEDGGHIVYTDCGTGTLVPCGEVEIQQCDSTVELDVNIIMRIFRIGTTKQNCRSIGHKPLYKDRFSYEPPTAHSNTSPTAPTAPPSAPPSCSTYERGKGLCTF